MEGNNNQRGDRRINPREGYRSETRGPYRSYKPRYEYPDERRDYGRRRLERRDYGRRLERRDYERRSESRNEVRSERRDTLTKESLDAQLIKYMEGNK